MNDHDLTNHMIERQAEKDRWAKVLGGKPRPDGDWAIGDDCCTYGECVGGHGCPVRETPLVWPELDLAEFPLHTAEGVKSQSKRAQAAIEKIALNTQNSDGSDPVADPFNGWELTPLGWAVAAIAVVSFLTLVYLKS